MHFIGVCEGLFGLLHHRIPAGWTHAYWYPKAFIEHQLIVLALMNYYEFYTYGKTLHESILQSKICDLFELKPIEFERQASRLSAICTLTLLKHNKPINETQTQPN